MVKSDSSVQGDNNGRQRFFLWNTARSISVGVDAGQGMMDGGPKKSEESSKGGEDREIFREAQLAGALRSTTDGER